MSEPTIEDVIDLCREHGLQYAGPGSDLMRFLRDALPAAQEHEECDPGWCDGCDERDGRIYELESKLETAQNAALPPQPAPDFSNLRAERT